MSVSIDQFWKLATQGQLLTSEQAAQYGDAFSKVKGASRQANVRTLAEWLVAENAISRYHSKVLLAGSAGPFVYGDYVVHDQETFSQYGPTFAARHRPTGESVGLFFFSGENTSVSRLWESNERRTQWAMTIDHPQLQRVLDLVQRDGYQFLVMERLLGEPICAALERQPRCSMEDVCVTGVAVARGLAAWHRAGQVHGLINCDAVWRNVDNQVILLHHPVVPLSVMRDMGDQQKEGAAYHAPELLAANAFPSPASDIYALGCVLVRMFGGRLPRRGEIASLPPEIPPAIIQVVLRMVAKNPGERFSSVQQAADALAAHCDARQIAVTRTSASKTSDAFSQWLGKHRELQIPRELEAQMRARLARHEDTSSTFTSDLPKDSKSTTTLPENGGATAGLSSSVFGGSFGTAGQASSGNSHSQQTAAPTRVMTSAEISAARRRSRKRAMLVITSTIVGVMLVGFGIVMFNSQNDDETTVAENNTALSPYSPDKDDSDGTGDKNDYRGTEKHSDQKTTNRDTQKTKIPKDDRGKGRDSDDAVGPMVEEVLIDDDDTTLWQSPTHGPPVTLKFHGFGAEAFLVVRCSDVLEHPEGERAFAALGPAGVLSRSDLEKTLGIPLIEIEQLVIAYYPNGLQSPLKSYVVTLSEPKEKKEFIEVWGNPSEVKQRDGTVLYMSEQVEDLVYYLPPETEGRQFVVGPIETLTGAFGKTKPLDLGQLDVLRKYSDRDRMVNLFFTPRFIFGDGRKIFPGVVETLRSPLEKFLGDDIRAVTFSLHLDEDLFLELRSLSAKERPAGDVVTGYLSKLQEVSGQVRDYLSGLAISSYSRKLMFQFPVQLQTVSVMTRGGVDEGHAVLRCYLPVAASVNLVAASELALLEGRGVSGLPDDGKPANASVSDRLKQKITLMFERDTLEKSVSLLGDEIGVEIKILGGDLQLEGITKNQSFGLNENNRPAGEILRAICKLANPDGKLVYVIKPETSDSKKEIIFVTTRSAVAKRGDKLPPELEK